MEAEQVEVWPVDHLFCASHIEQNKNAVGQEILVYYKH